MRAAAFKASTAALPCVTGCTASPQTLVCPPSPLRGRTGRVLPEMQSPPTEKMPDREPATEVPWLEPYPDSALEGVADRSPGPDLRYEMREAVQLAFIARYSAFAAATRRAPAR